MASTIVPTAPYDSTVSARPAPTAAPARRAIDWRVLLLGVVLLSLAYTAWHLGRGWVAHDEGTLGQSAERLLQGELPHRDFDELYTGGLTWINAAAFSVFGTTLFVLRLVLLAAFAAWVPAVFYIASRLVRPPAAAGVTLLCVVWSVPNYTAPLPSWYNLFLTVFGVAALFRWIEDRRAPWLVVAGIAGGLSLLVKVVGLYFVAGALLFLVFEAHRHARAEAGAAPRSAWPYAAFVTSCLLVFCAALAATVRRQAFAGEIVQFVVPGLLVAGFLIRNEWTVPAGASARRFAALARLVTPFLIGVAIPVVVFLVPFVRGDAVGALVNGVFVLPAKRIGTASFRMLPPWSMLALLPAWLLLVYGRRIAGRVSRYHVAALAIALGTYLAATATVPLMYRIVWYAVRGVLPVFVLAGLVLLARERDADEDSTLRRSRLMLLLGVTAVYTLVQFPFSVPIYFCYVAPLVALLGVALLPPARRLAPAVPALMTAFLIAFAVLRVNTSTLFGMGVLYQPYPLTASLGLPRGQLDVPAQEAVMYRVAVRTLQTHARGGYTWASPDCPEIYFLSGLRNPTRSLFDFFDDETGRTARILSTLERRGVTAIVLNSAPQFTNGIAEDLVAELERRYPFGANIGKFQVRWQ